MKVARAAARMAAHRPRLEVEDHDESAEGQDRRRHGTDDLAGDDAVLVGHPTQHQDEGRGDDGGRAARWSRRRHPG